MKKSVKNNSPKKKITSQKIPSKKINKSWFIIPILIIILGIIYLSFFKTTQTGIDLNAKNGSFLNDGENQSNKFTKEDNQTKNDTIVPPIDKPKGDGGGGSTAPMPNDTYIRPPFIIDINDTDAFELNGNVLTLNFWTQGTCTDEQHPSGLQDFCTDNILTEYHIEDNNCIPQNISCLSFAEFYKTGTELACYSGTCIYKEGGINFKQKDYLMNEGALWDECMENGLLKEWFISKQGIPAYTFANCSEMYGQDYKCYKGACEEMPEILPEPYAVDSDEMNFYNFGNCQTSSAVYLDHCTEYGSLIEYIVNPNIPQECLAVDTYCPTGICSYGKCIVIDYDAHLPSPYETKSICTKNFQTNVTDICNCLNDGNPCYYLREYFVSNNECTYEIVDCRTTLNNTNAQCSEGKCFIYSRSSR